jgi:hypothetical protein
MPCPKPVSVNTTVVNLLYGENPYWEANDRSDKQPISSLPLRYPKLHYQTRSEPDGSQSASFYSTSPFYCYPLPTVVVQR